MAKTSNWKPVVSMRGKTALCGSEEGDPCVGKSQAKSGPKVMASPEQTPVTKS